MAWWTIGPAEDFTEGQSQAVTAGGHDIAICRAEGQLYAIENQCSHALSPLAGGRIRGCFLWCPLHGVRFDLRTGMPLGELTRTKVPVYPVRLAGDQVEIELP